MAISSFTALCLALSANAATLDTEQVATRDRLLQAYDGAMEIGQNTDRPPVCLTGLVKDLREHWELFDPADQKRMASFLAPWNGENLDLSRGPGRPATTGDEPPPPPPADRDSPCWGHYYDNYTVTDHFSVEWQDGVSRSYADDFSESLEYSWQVEVDELGWNRPDGTETYPMMALIVNHGGYSGAYTSIENCNGQYVPYIVAYSGSWSSGTWAKDMAAHEFKHTIQFSTSYAPEFWYWEASAVWMQEQVYPSHNWWPYYVEMYTEEPHIGLNASSRDDQDIFYHMYGASIFNFLLDNWYDGQDTVKAMWDNAERQNGYYDHTVWENVEGIGLDFEEVFTNFMAANTVMDYDEQGAYPDIDVHDVVNGLPDAGESSSSDEPQSLGLNYIRFDEDAFGGQDLRVDFAGESGPDHWFAILVSTEDDEVREIVTLELDDDFSGDAWIAPQDGDVYLVVSPWDESVQGYHYNWERAESWSYTWTAELGEGAEEPEENEDTGYDKIDDLPERPGVDDEGEGGVGMPGCGCASGGGAASGAALGLMGLAGLAIRRRRD